MNTLIYNQGLTLPDNECKAGYSPLFIRSNRSDGFGFIYTKSAYADSAILGTTEGGSSQTLVKEITADNNIIAVYCPDGARVYCDNSNVSVIIPIANISWDGASFAGYTNTYYYFNPLLFSKANILITMSAGYKGGYNGRNIYVPSQYEVYHINRSGMMLLNPQFRWLQKETHIKCTASSLRCDFGGTYNVAPRSEKVYVIDDFKGSMSIMNPFTSPYYPILFHNCTLTGLNVNSNLTLYLNNQTLIDDAESLSFYKNILTRINNVTSTRTITLYVKSSIASDIEAITDNAPSNITYITNVTD